MNPQFKRLSFQPGSFSPVRFLKLHLPDCSADCFTVAFLSLLTQQAWRLKSRWMCDLKNKDAVEKWWLSLNFQGFASVLFSPLSPLTFPLAQRQLRVVQRVVVQLCFCLFLWFSELGEVRQSEGLCGRGPALRVQQQHALQHRHGWGTRADLGQRPAVGTQNTSSRRFSWTSDLGGLLWKTLYGGPSSQLLEDFWCSVLPADDANIFHLEQRISSCSFFFFLTTYILRIQFGSKFLSWCSCNLHDLI